ncbi:MAG TPA: hypothetical protein PK771_13805 [Spirochaetota bacterium]|nr:hypothetical protein [Spirochaetota bacterium]
MLFCKLEPDKKTYDYLKEYLDFLSKKEDFHNRSILYIDNKIQHQELHYHLNRININPNDDSSERNNEVEKWIKENAKPFRMYLSSIKILACASYTKGFTNSADLKFDDFEKLCSDINILKDVLIDHIF